MLGLFIGSLWAKIKLPKLRFPLSSIGFRFRNVATFSMLLQLYIIFFFSATAILADEFLWGEFRILESKASQFLVIAASFLAVVCIARRKYVAVSIFFSLALVALFAFVDSSRTALIPLTILGGFYLLRRKFVSALFFVFPIPFVLFYVLFARDFVSVGGDRSVDLIFLAYQNFSGVDVSYLLSFSFLHLLYALQDGRGSFAGWDLIYSVIPLPSDFMPFSVDTYLWRIDANRTIGGMASLLTVGTPYFILFHVLVGFVAVRLARLGSGPVKSLALAVAV